MTAQAGGPDAVPPPLDLRDAADELALRRFFRRHAAAVAVVTASHAGRPVGLLATSLASVSPAPPQVSFNVARTSSSWPALAEAVHVGLHVLGDGQEELARRFATSGADRFAPPTSWRWGPHAVPVVGGTAARAVGEVVTRVDAGDHVVVLARLLWADADDAGAPLLHHDGAYRRLHDTPRG